MRVSWRTLNAFDVAVVGAGHAGIEAALACARRGLRTACITLRLERIGHLPCNCSIGGPAKGHLAREVDALGGQMAVTADHTLTHVRRAATGRGPAAQTLRLHVDKDRYPAFMQRVLREPPHLTLIEARVDRILGSRQVEGLEIVPTGTHQSVTLCARAVILTTGTFLNGLCHEGAQQTVAARHGDAAVHTLTDDLKARGLRTRRFKTGTTPRLHAGSIDWDALEAVPSEPDAGALSFLHDAAFPERPLLACHQTHTTPHTHEVLRQNLHQSAIFSGAIQGVGPRYCPSVEDKVVRFADRDHHPVFLEWETWDGPLIYVQGFSTSLPADVQREALRTIPGLERAEIVRPGYAVEYDMVDPIQLTSALMVPELPGLFLAGQVNGTSGYEEAAAQGIAAGIQAGQYVRDEPPVTLSREGSFLGVMLDDLTTKGVEDPYRMLTARAEHRLLLRHDNADDRLTPLGRQLGLVDDARWSRFEAKQTLMAKGRAWLEQTRVGPAHSEALEGVGTAGIGASTTLFDLLRRPELSLDDLLSVLPGSSIPPWEAEDVTEPLRVAVRDRMKLLALYEGYIQAQARVVERSAKWESLTIPPGFDYAALRGLSHESREKLGRTRPSTLGQASRMPGVRAADVALLAGTLRRR